MDAAGVTRTGPAPTLPDDWPTPNIRWVPPATEAGNVTYLATQAPLGSLASGVAVIVSVAVGEDGDRSTERIDGARSTTVTTGEATHGPETPRESVYWTFAWIRSPCWRFRFPTNSVALDWPCRTL